MKNVVIFGTTDFGRMMKYYIEKENKRKAVAFTVNREYINDDFFCGLPVVAFEEIEQIYMPSSFEILIAIGNSKMNEVRETVFANCKGKGYEVASFIDSSCRIHSNDIGEGNILLDNCIIYPFAKIGKGNLMWNHVTISHDCEIGNFNTFASYADLSGYVKVGNNGFFGKHCIVNEFTKVADYTLVGAGAYVKGKTNPYDVVVPARSITLDNHKSIDLM